MKKPEKTGKYMITAGTVFIVAAVFLIAYNIYSEISAGRKSGDILNSFNIESPDNGRTPDYLLSPDVEMPEAEINGVNCIGVLEIPSLGLKLPVISECNRANLKIAPCRYSGSAYDDNFVIAGHNYRTHFRSIQKLKSGNSVIFTDADGNRFEYAVSTVDVLHPTDVAEMNAGEWPLTLFTCNSSGSMRVTVRCDKVE